MTGRGEAPPFPPDPDGARGYAILATPRSGSSHLCRLLESTGVLGRPSEYLNVDRAALLAEAAAAAGGLWPGLRRLGSTPNGVFALKAFYGQLVHHAPRGIPRLVFDLPTVFLTRTDKLGQAISHARALQTGQWGAHQPAAGPPRYDARAIGACLRGILDDEACFEEVFAMLGRPVLRLVYEDFTAAPAAAVAAIGALVGVDVGDVRPVSPQRRQRDELSAEWRRRYLAEREPWARLPRMEAASPWLRLRRRSLRALSFARSGRPKG